MKVAPFFNIPSKKSKFTILCDKHPKKEVEFKCLNDFVFLCSSCQIEHEKTHQIEKFNIVDDLTLIEEKLDQLQFRANSFLEKAKTVKNASSSKSVEVLDLFKSSINLIKSPFCIQLSKEHFGRDLFPLDFSSVMSLDLKKISKIAESLDSKEIKFIEELFLPTKIEKICLLFRASQNCFSAQKFHASCDFKGPTLSLIKSKTGKVFGGFCSISWVYDEKGSYYSAPESFVFSVNGLKKFPLKNEFDDEAIYNCNQYGPTFGNGYDIYISDSCNVKNDSYSNFGSTFRIQKSLFEAKSSEARSYLASSYKFKVDEYEVFSLKLIT